MALPGASFSGGMPGEPPTPKVPYASAGKAQPTTHGPKVKTVNVKAHTRVITPKAPKVTAPAIDPQTKNLIAAAVKLKYGGAEQGLNQQLAQNSRFAAGAPAWYGQAIQQIKAQQTPVPQVAAPAPTGDPATDSRNAAAYGFEQQRNNALGAGNTFLTNVGAGLTAQQGNTLNQANATKQNLLSQQTQLKGQEGDFKTTTLNDIQSAQAKSEIDNKKIEASLLIAQGKTDMAQKVLESLNQNNAAKNQIARSNSRTTRLNAKNTATKQQHDTMLADKRFQLDQQKFGEQVAKDQYQQKHHTGSFKNTAGGSDLVHRGAAVLRLLHGTPPAKDPTSGQVTKPNPFYNLNYQQISAHKQDLIDMLQTSSKAGHLSHTQAVRAANQFLKEMKAGVATGLVNNATGESKKLANKLKVK